MEQWYMLYAFICSYKFNAMTCISLFIASSTKFTTCRRPRDMQSISMLHHTPPLAVLILLRKRQNCIPILFHFSTLRVKILVLMICVYEIGVLRPQMPPDIGRQQNAACLLHGIHRWHLYSHWRLKIRCLDGSLDFQSFASFWKLRVWSIKILPC